MINQEAESISTIPAAILRVDKDWCIDEVNKSAEDLIGMAADKLTGKSAREIFQTQKKFAEILTLCELAQQGKNISNHPVRIAGDKEIGEKSFFTTILPLTDENQTDAGAIIYMEEPSGQSFAQFVVNSMGDGVFTVDRNWNITFFNRAAERITGWRTDEAVGKSCSELFQSNICGKNCAIAESLYLGKNIINRSITIISKNGEKIPVSISASPLTDHDGNIIGGVQSFRDLSILTLTPKNLNRKYRFHEIVSKSRAMQRLFTILPDVACSPSTVMIGGESGTGKELIATALYNISDRKDGPFVVLNCGALPEALLESELFGYKAGAFTDAKKDKPGRMAAADTGTLFLDEIGEIPGSVQVKLLRVLQEKVYEPLGSNTSIPVDVRIITATNQDLKELVKQGQFREDLYYRLNVVNIHLPPLRDRKEDIPLLIEQFIEEYSHQLGKDIVGISNPALNVLMRHDYPGNIRELKNIIEYAFILCEGGYIQPDHLPEPFNVASDAPVATDFSEPEHRMTLEEIEKQAIYFALENNRWKKSATCEELGISKDTLRRKMQKYHFDEPGEEDSSL